VLTALARRTTAASSDIANQLSLCILSTTSDPSFAGADIRVVCEKLAKVLKRHLSRRSVSNLNFGFAQQPDTTSDYAGMFQASAALASAPAYNEHYNPYEASTTSRLNNAHPGYNHKRGLSEPILHMQAQQYYEPTLLNYGMERRSAQTPFEPSRPMQAETMVRPKTSNSRPKVYRQGIYGNEILPTPTGSNQSSYNNLADMFGGLTMREEGSHANNFMMQQPAQPRPRATSSNYYPTQVTASITKHYAPVSSNYQQTLSHSPRLNTPYMGYTAPSYTDEPLLSDFNMMGGLPAPASARFSPPMLPYGSATPLGQDYYETPIPRSVPTPQMQRRILTVEVQGALKLQSSRRPFMCSVVRL
jgi:hypothetical protein